MIVSLALLAGVHPENLDGRSAVFIWETRKVYQGQGNQVLARRSRCLRRTSKRAD